MTRLLVLYLLFLLPSTLALAKPRCKLSLGWQNWPPYQYKDQNKQITGLDIELVRAISKEINCELKLIEMPWERLLRSNKLGNIKMTASTTKTIERAKSGHFSLPYRKEQMVLFTLKEQQFNIHSIEQLRILAFKLGLRKAVSFGPEFDLLVNDPHFNQSIQFVTNAKQNIQKVQRNRLDGFADDFVATTALLKSLGVNELFEVQPINIFSTDLHIMFSKRSVDKAIVERFNQGLRTLQTNGKYQKILNEYLLKE
jgi:polar amino acid transport system substrate-binding protein